MELVHSRFKILDAPFMAPGKCTVCGSSETETRKYIDFGFQLDWYGAIYLCTECVTEAGSVIGLAPEANWNLAHANLQEEISRGDDRYVETKAQLDAARVLLRNCHCCDPDSGFICLDTNKKSSESESEASGDSVDDDESSSIEGFDDVPESSDDVEPDPPKRNRRKSASSE